MPSSYQIVLWKQESFAVPRPLQIEFFRNLLGLVAQFSTLKERTPKNVLALKGRLVPQVRVRSLHANLGPSAP